MFSGGPDGLNEQRAPRAARRPYSRPLRVCLRAHHQGTPRLRRGHRAATAPPRGARENFGEHDLPLLRKILQLHQNLYPLQNDRESDYSAYQRFERLDCRYLHGPPRSCAGPE